MTEMASGTRFVVQWEEHPSHLASRLGQLLEQQTLVDVTLMCNTHTLRVHRSVLAACSPYFENLLQNISQRQLVQHPLIVLKDMQFSVLKCMIEFMYCGETNVTEDDLGPLLQAARFFQVKGLSSMTKEALGLPPSKPTKPKVNGDVSKPAPKTISSSNMVTTSTPKTQTLQTQLMNTKANKPLAVRESPGLTASGSSDPAELLLSLSGELESKNMTTTTSTTGGQTKTILMQPKTTTKAMTTAQRAWNTRPAGASGDTAFTLAPNQSEGSMPIYQPGPRKRGRPLKQQMNLVFQEKILTDTDMALRKEADASRRALEALQKEMSGGESEDQSESSPGPAPRMRTATTVGKGTAIASQSKTTTVAATPLVKTVSSPGLVMKSKLVATPSSVTGKVQTTTAAAATTSVAASSIKKVLQAPQQQTATTVASVAATSTTTVTDSEENNNSGVTEESSSNNTVTYQIADTGSGASVMSQYMEVLKEAGLPTDVPILMDSGDGNYVTVNEEVLMNIVNGGVLQCHVTEENLQGMVVDGETQKEVKLDEATGTYTLEGDAGDLQNQVVRYVGENGEIVEGVLAVVQEGEEGTTVAVTPSGQVLQIQATGDGDEYRLVDASEVQHVEQGEESMTLISGDTEPVSEEQQQEEDQQQQEEHEQQQQEEQPEEEGEVQQQETQEAQEEGEGEVQQQGEKRSAEDEECIENPAKKMKAEEEEEATESATVD